MRALFLLLVLANLVFFAYAHVARDGADVRARIAQLEISPDKIKPLKSVVQAPPERPKSQGRAIPPATPKPAAACLEWGLFAGPAVAKAFRHAQGDGVQLIDPEFPFQVEETRYPAHSRSLNGITPSTRRDGAGRSIAISQAQQIAQGQHNARIFGRHLGLPFEILLDVRDVQLVPLD